MVEKNLECVVHNIVDNYDQMHVFFIIYNKQLGFIDTII